MEKTTITIMNHNFTNGTNYDENHAITGFNFYTPAHIELNPDYGDKCVLRFSKSGVNPILIIVPNTIPVDAVPEFLRTFRRACYTFDYYKTTTSLKSARDSVKVARETVQNLEHDIQAGKASEVDVLNAKQDYHTELKTSEKIRHKIAVWRAQTKWMYHNQGADIRTLSPKELSAEENRSAVMLAINECGTVKFGGTKDYNLGGSPVFAPTAKVNDAVALMNDLADSLEVCYKKSESQFSAKQFTVKFSHEQFENFKAMRTYLQDCCRLWFMDDKASVNKNIVLTVCALAFSAPHKDKKSTGIVKDAGKVKGTTFLLNTYRVLYKNMYGGLVDPDAE